MPQQSFTRRCLKSQAARGALAVILASLLSQAAIAQPASGAPGTVPQGSPIPRVLPAPTPGALPAAPGLTAPVAPGTVPGGNVAIRRATVQGATAYPDARLAPLIGGLAGRTVPVARIEEARAAILSLYRGDGYALTTVTATVDPAGDVRFSVIEGRIAEVQLDGDIGPAGVQVLRFLRRLTEERPISNDTLERWLLLAQDVPGVTLQAILRPSADDPGALTLVAQVSRQALGGLFTLDNRAFRLTGPEQGLLVVDGNSFTQLGERTQVSLYRTNGSTQNFGQVSTEAFAGSSGLRVRLYGGYGEAYPSDVLRTIGYQGFTTTFGVAAIYPIIRQRQQTLNAFVNLDFINTEVRLNIGPNGERQRAARDDLRVGRIGAEYALSDVALGGERPGLNYARLIVSQGLPFLGGTGNDNPLPGRRGSKTDFTKVSVELSRTQTLFSPWSGASVALRARVLGQATADVLPPSEKFFLGGTEINRGFYAGEVSGDNVITGSIELQLNTGFDVPVFGRTVPVTTQFYAFFDAGRTWENRRGDINADLSSQGIGARTNITRYTQFDIEGVVRNTRLPSGTAGVVKPLKGEAVYWRVLTRF